MRGDQVVAAAERAERVAARIETQQYPIRREDIAEGLRALSAALLELVRESQEGPRAA